jgi:hypothetical protein
MSQPSEVVAQDPRDRPRSDGEERDASDPLPPEAFPVTVEGQEVSQADDGFGQLWRKRYRVPLIGANVPPAEVVLIWRERFGEFWPTGNRFYRPLYGLERGEVALIDLAMPVGTRLSTGVVVLEVRDTSFSFATAPGHTFAGTITFSAYPAASETVAQVEMLLRASDPLFELALPLGGHRRDDRFWQATLQNLAAHFGVTAEPDTFKQCVDLHRHWRKAGNIVRNSYMKTAVHLITLPFRRLILRLRFPASGRT